jgi:hypothetical protein
MTPERRAALLAEYAALSGDQRAEDDAGRAARQALRDEYVAGLPRPRLARDPFTGTVVAHSVDTAGLDGLWWRYEDVVRPVEDLPRTFFAITGAVTLADAVEDVPFLVKPGPEVPYVIPRMLLHRDVRAVVSALPVGAHTGYAVTYFADPAPPMLARCNAWGANEHWFTDDGGTGWDTSDEEDDDPDYDLASWVESGKLQWVAPGDTEVRLKKGLEGCPFVDLPGRRSFVRVQDGVAWTPEDVAATPSRPRSRTPRSTARPSA